MLLATGIGLSGYGLVSLIGLFLQIQKVNNNPYLRLDEEAAIKMGMIAVVALVLGIVLIFFAVVRSKNKAAYDKMKNFEQDSLSQAKCKACGLNLTEDTKVCPKCGTKRE